jgi:hypothetical protein
MMMVPFETRPSPIHGLGIFATIFLPKGTLIWEFTEGFDTELSAEEYGIEK